MCTPTCTRTQLSVYELRLTVCVVQPAAGVPAERVPGQVIKQALEDHSLGHFPKPEVVNLQVRPVRRETTLRRITAQHLLEQVSGRRTGGSYRQAGGGDKVRKPENRGPRVPAFPVRVPGTEYLIR